jgi:hypothetical protein
MGPRSIFTPSTGGIIDGSLSPQSFNFGAIDKSQGENAPLDEEHVPEKLIVFDEPPPPVKFHHQNQFSF